MLDISCYLLSCDNGICHLEQSSNAVCQQEQRHMNVVFQYELPGFGMKYCRLGSFHCLLKMCSIICSLHKRLGYRPNITCNRPRRLDLLQGELQVTLTSDTVEFLAPG
jgi:hypothetical protein